MLESYFEAARRESVEASPVLLARVLADAEAEQANLAMSGATVAPDRQSVFANLLAGIGGWPSVAGLATATVAGIWIGFSAPETVDGLAGGVLSLTDGSELNDLMPTLDGLFLEG